MTIAAKAAAVTLGGGGMVTLGCYVCGVFNGTEWHSLIEDASGTGTNDYTNKLGDKAKYGLFLTGVTNTKNEGWWKESYKRYEADTKITGENAHHFSTLFAYAAETANAKVISAFSDTDNKALNKVCGEAYKKVLNTNIDFNYTTIAQDTDDKHKLAADILKYCSPLIELPKILEASTNNAPYASNTVGSQGSTKKLVKTDESKNDFFWMQQQEWFKEQGKSPNSLDAYFTQFFEGGNGNKQLKPGQNIRTICEETYKKEANTNENATKEKPKIDDVAKYCSFVRPTN